MNHSFETLCVHGGQHKYEEASGTLITPIYQSAAFSHTKLGHNDHGFDYTRISNPTRQALEETISALEGAVDTISFTSGMAAITTCFELFSPGDHIICSEDLYGGTVLMFHTIGEKNGLKFSFVDTAELSKVRSALTPATRAIFLETPSNPMMNVTDIAACADIAHQVGAMVIVDNTFLSPYFQNPLSLGADLVIHSGTKYLCGHNDTISGFLCCANAEVAEKARKLAWTAGATLSPLDCWLTSRGLKTLPIRMERQQQTALAIARWLKAQPKVRKVYYVGLPEHPGYETNRKQARGFGGMLSFTVDSPETALHLLQHVKVITFAESLGGPESLITYPSTQTHRDVAPEEQRRLGITDCLLRLSVGLENENDLIEDLRQAMEG